ncbi:MAG: 23S rRNA pseudouridine synthase [Parcubacteria group bacterium Gr01-1014_48]|nr:MAG: 23S rRNA pseudouridine synthase [Parcubacteria group bacterium Greene0416_14]TSC74024.1 MAG: 23S rRNA pseudouridine synthase [Parcubacteria group bacterium Gr01-1014_48]TSD00802.1 MAG: 23S rRNA pseudouridine synthase [Parcubacteria group bacterium Greene1014_15]TSD07200.1 MAG: 23S rRNA pseudouridine synthase [Parcubacteria group bacterium Greene0714_4]
MKSISIMYEDDALVAINKPPGVLVHTDGHESEPTIVDWMLENYPQARDVGEPMFLSNGKQITRPGVVHRIDRETSGVLLLCKTQEAFLFLKKQFQEREIKKIYNAFVYGVLKEKRGSIDLPISRSKKDFRMYVASFVPKGRSRTAVTEYSVIQEREDSSFVELYPKTGRTHQIRVHMKALNHPVICDSLYAPKRPCLLGFERLALHARMITFKHPNGSILSLEAPFPEDFEHALSLFSAKI